MSIIRRKTGKRPSVRIMVMVSIGTPLFIFMIFFTFVFVSSTMTLLSKSERDQINAKSEIVVNAINASITSTRALTRDWASWDDTYEFAMGNKPDHFTKFWTKDWKIQGQRLNFIYVKDLSGNDLYTKHYDYYEKQSVSAPEGFTDYISTLSETVLNKYYEQKHLMEVYGLIEPFGIDGMVFYNNAAYYISAMPILTYDEQSAPAGVMLLGRIFDEHEVERVANAENLHFTVLSGSSEELAGKEASSVAGEGFILSTDDVIASYRPLAGFFPDDSIYLKIEKNRTLFISGFGVIKLSIVIVPISMALLSLAIFYILDRFLLRNIERLSNDMHAVRVASEKIDAESYEQSREFYTLASSVNGMLDKLDLSLQAAAESAISMNILQSLLDALDAYLFVGDLDTYEVLFVNDKMKEHFKLGEDIIGKPCRSVIKPCMERKCEFCARPKLLENPNKPVVSEKYIEVTGKYYRTVDRIIKWHGRERAHLQYYIDITELKNTEASLQSRLDTQAVLAAMSKSFIVNDDTDVLIVNALQMTGEIMGADRILLAEYDKDNQTLIFKHELFNRNFDLSEGRSDTLAFGDGSYLFDEMSQNNFLSTTIDDVSESGYEDAKALGIKSSLLIPIYAVGELWGILEYDKCNVHEWVSDEVYTGNLVSSMLSGALMQRSTKEKMAVVSDFFRIISNPIFELDTDASFIKAYSENFAFAGYKMQDLLTKKLSDFIVPEDDARIADVLRSAAAEHDHIKELECRVVSKDGEVLDYLLDILPIFDSYGNHTAYRSSYTDITEKMKSARQLLRVSKMIDSAPQYISYVDMEGNYDFVNPATFDITGYSYEELMEQGMFTLYDEQTVRLFREEILPAILEKGDYVFELPLTRKDGEVIIMSFSAFVIESEESGIGCIATDITERKRLERELTKAKEMAEQANSAKSEFLSRMSHEIRTPMNVIIGMAGIGKSANDISKKDNCLNRIDNASQFLLGVINDILDMSKIEANKFELSGKTFSIDKMLSNIVDIVGFNIKSKGQALNLTVDDTTPDYIFGDEQRLSQVITNLLSNASKFTPKDGEIGLGIRCLGIKNETCTLEIRVTDNGIGISAEQQARLFNPFEQADGGIARKYGGTGLGLAISKRIVELMDGRIWIDSDVGKGSKFIFMINVKKATGPTEAEHAEGGAHTGLSPEDPDFSKHTLLLAEDIEMNREIMSSLLEDTGAILEFAENGLQAYEMFAANPTRYSLIMMDVHMPEMDGYESTKKIRALDIEEATTIPIIAMTANVFREDIDRCLASGMNDHIGKPINVDELFEKVSTFLRKRNK